MLVVGVCSIEMRDFANFFFNKIELHINVLGARSTPSIPKERISGIITKQFQPPKIE